MTLMREIRLTLHLTQQEMAVSYGLARQSWQALERGLVLVSPEVEGKLGLGPLPCSGDTLTRRELQRWLDHPCFAFEAVNSGPWLTVQRNKRFILSLFSAVSARTRRWMQLLVH